MKRGMHLTINGLATGSTNTGLHWNFLSDLDGTVHRDVKLFVLHDKVAQL